MVAASGSYAAPWPAIVIGILTGPVPVFAGLSASLLTEWRKRRG